MGTFSDETETSDHKQNHKCSSKKIEVGEGLNLNTVACLRGRLLAERNASKVAKEQAESMGKKLVELEKLVKQEIKLRDKSERKLKLLRKKLESSSKSSDSSQKSENSCGSSSISSNSKNSEANGSRNCAKDSALTESLVPNHNGSRSENGSSNIKDCDSQITDNSSSSNYSEHGYSSVKILSQNSNPSFEFENLKNDKNSESKDLKNDEIRLSSLSTNSSVTENESDHADSFDNSLALVPVSVNMTAISQARTNQKQVNENVFEALDALRVAKEKLRSSLGTREMIQVGLN